MKKTHRDNQFLSDQVWLTISSQSEKTNLIKYPWTKTKRSDRIMIQITWVWLVRFSKLRTKFTSSSRMWFRKLRKWKILIFNKLGMNKPRMNRRSKLLEQNQKSKFSKMITGLLTSMILCLALYAPSAQKFQLVAVQILWARRSAASSFAKIMVSIWVPIQIRRLLLHLVVFRPTNKISN